MGDKTTQVCGATAGGLTGAVYGSALLMLAAPVAPAVAVGVGVIGTYGALIGWLATSSKK
uniref:Uncharacterized protein n=1 Tax=Anopheles albimanus TaxID=7167 RepID=A0A182FXK0_ANOAL